MRLLIGCSLACGLAAAALSLPADAGRLFATANGIDGILELDPVTGQTLNTLASPPAGFQDGLAYDGQSLWFIGETGNTLFQLDPGTGQTLATFDLPDISSNDPEIGDGQRGGMAYLNGELYITNWDVQSQDIEVFSIAAGEVVRILDINGTNPDLLHGFGNSGLAAITGPDQLILNTALSQEVYFIDPVTGEVTDAITHNQFGVFGIAVLGEEIYLGSSSIGLPDDTIEHIHVYDRGLNELYNFNVEGTIGINALAGDHTAIPEPGTAALLALGAFALTRRRRH